MRLIYMKKFDLLTITVVIFGIGFLAYVAVISKKLNHSQNQETKVSDKNDRKFINWKSALPDQ